MQRPSWQLWLKAGLGALALGVLLAWWGFTPPGVLGKADAIGYAVCHRIPSHSFFLGDRPLPLCARCSGTFLGALIGLTFQLPRGRRALAPSWPFRLVFIAFALAFVLDGVNSFLSLIPHLPALYPPNNLLRLATGSGFGLGISALLVPLFSRVVWTDPCPEPALSQGWQLFGLLGTTALGALGIASHIPILVFPLALLSALGVLTLLTLCYTLFWILLLKRENSFSDWNALRGFLLAGLGTALLQIFLVDGMRFFLTGTWAGFVLP